jgi:hypothetical protein
MSILTGVFKNGSIQLDHPPAEWDEGERVTIHTFPTDRIVGMTEEEQGDDPASIERWMEWNRSVLVLEMSPEVEADMLAWRKKVKEVNREAVRRQFEDGIPGAPE